MLFANYGNYHDFAFKNRNLDMKGFGTHLKSRSSPALGSNKVHEQDMRSQEDWFWTRNSTVMKPS
jgi:hypothetical protein